MQRTDSLEKTRMLVKIEVRRRRGRQRMRWSDRITDSMDMSWVNPEGWWSAVHGVVKSWTELDLQPARLLCPWDSQDKTVEWAAMGSSKGSSQLKDWIRVSHGEGRFFTVWTTNSSTTRHNLKNSLPSSIRQCFQCCLKPVAPRRLSLFNNAACQVLD